MKIEIQKGALSVTVNIVPETPPLRRLQETIWTILEEDRESAATLAGVPVRVIGDHEKLLDFLQGLLTFPDLTQNEAEILHFVVGAAQGASLTPQEAARVAQPAYPPEEQKTRREPVPAPARQVPPERAIDAAPREVAAEPKREPTVRRIGEPRPNWDEIETGPMPGQALHKSRLRQRVRRMSEGQKDE